jgi:hypothetical protein
VPLAPKAPGARSAPDKFLSIYSPFNLIKGPKGPEPALGFFEKKPGLSHSGRFASKTTKVSPNEPGGRANVFSFLRYYYYVNVTFSSTLRYVAGAAFSFALRYRSGRETHRGSR